MATTALQIGAEYIVNGTRMTYIGAIRSISARQMMHRFKVGPHISGILDRELAQFVKAS